LGIAAVGSSDRIEVAGRSGIVRIVQLLLGQQGSRLVVQFRREL
jgi:hypothetical protein